MLGFVATSQRRRIFVNANRLAALDSDGARLRSWDVDLNPFKPQRRRAARSAATSSTRKVGDETVSDVALRAARRRPPRRGGSSPRSAWRGARALRRRPSYRLVDCRRGARPVRRAPEPRWPPRRPACATCTPATSPASCARCRSTQRRQLAEAMDDERLADLLEELPEAEQLRIIEGLDLERLRQRARRDGVRRPRRPARPRCRASSAPDPRGDGRRGRRRHAPPAVLRGGHRRRADDARDHHPRPDGDGGRGARRDPRSRTGWSSIAAQVFVVPAAVQAADRHLPRRRPLPAAAARAAAACELGAVPRAGADDHARPARARGRRAAGQLQHARRRVCDEAGRLLGAITVDDVLDRTLPTGWRQRRRAAACTGTAPRGGVRSR